MKENNVVQKKSYDFALSIIKLCRSLTEEKKDRNLSSQLFRSGTSIGANIEEAIGGQSRKDFNAKLYIAYKEARETHYWLRLLRDASFVEPITANILLEQCNELLKLLGAILRTLRSR
jgi:four helix bundle protein